MTDDPEDNPGRPPGRPKGTKSPRLGANTVFGHLVGACGLTHQDAADYLGVSVQSVRAYASGAQKTPVRVMDRIADLWERISYRVEIRGPDLPEPARARREALQTVRMKTWRGGD